MPFPDAIQLLAPQVVQETAELRRIRDLPRRVWQDDPALPRLIELMTNWLRHTPTRCAGRCVGCDAQALKPAQAILLREFNDSRSVIGVHGACGPLRPGAGKTLVALLAPTVIKATKPLLVVPAGQLPRMRQEGLQYARHWRVAPVEMVTYEFLSHPKNLHWLAQFDPDCVICDESHKLKSTQSKGWKRLFKLMRDKPTMAVMFLSASYSHLLGYGHIVRAALRSRAPVPSDPFERRSWALAMDDDVHELDKVAPGALLRLGPDVPAPDDRTKARRIYQSRLTSTKGYVSTLEDIPPCSLYLNVHELAIPGHMQTAIQTMREKGETPWGESFVCAADLWRHSRTMGGYGLFHRWDPPAPGPWREARRAWHAFAREELKGARDIDSTVHIEEAIKAGELDDGGLLAAWEQIEPTFKPNSVPVWKDDTPLHFATEWLKEHEGLVWVDTPEFGRRLEAHAGVPYFSSGGLDSTGRLIDLYKGPAIVSIAACREGHNMQKTHHRNLFMTPPVTHEWLEQALARTHRDGQVEDEVHATFLLTTKETYLTLARTARKAQADYEAHGQPQKILYGTRDLGPVEELINNPEMECGV